MRVFIIDSKNNSTPINIMESDSVSELKKQIKIKNKISDNIELLFNGNILNDNDNLADLEIVEGATINYLGIFKAGLIK
jgi:hypothetical protein